MVSSAPVTTIYYNATNVAAPVGSRPLLLSRVSLSFSPSLCVSYIHRPRPSSHAKSFTSYITQWGGERMMTESLDLMPIHKRRMCVCTAQHTAHSRRRRRVLPLPHRSLLSSRECFCRVCVMAEMRNFSSPSPPRTFFYFYFTALFIIS